MGTSNTILDLRTVGLDPEMNASQRGERGMFEATPFRIDIGTDIADNGFRTDRPVGGDTVTKDVAKKLLVLLMAGIKAIAGMKAFKAYAFGETFEVSPELMEKSIRYTFGDEDGNIKAPKHRVYDGNNRIAGVVIANALLLKAGKGYGELIHEVPAEIESETLDDETRWFRATQGNKGTACEAVPFYLDVLNFWRYCAKGRDYNEAIRKLFRVDPNKKSALRQRFSTLCNLFKEYKEHPEVLGVFQKGEAKGAASAYNHAVVSKLLKPDADSGEYLTGSKDKPSVEEVVAFLQDPKGFQKGVKEDSDKNDPITPKQLANIITGSENPVKATMLDQLRNGDREGLAEWEVCPELWRCLLYLVTRGHHEVTLAAIKPVFEQCQKADYEAQEQE